jgi:alginate O-acetyltransferase complex protein AlgI
MLFNSVEFLFFLPVVTILYFLVPAKVRWLLLLAASYVFFLSWIPEYIFLILISTSIAFISAIKLENETDATSRRRYLWASIFINLGILIVFKYYNFINENVRMVFGTFTAAYPVPNLHLLAPLGISFYTLQIVGYLLDVYHRRLKAERNAGIFALFVSFFPQLAAGPIERGKNMLPQFHANHAFDYERVTGGLIRIAWGFFKKLVIADRLGLLVNTVYSNPGSYVGNPLILATYAFAIQIYFDFSAYSDIAIGTAQILGFDLKENFKQPYFSKSVPEFWRNWHISLSTWFRDYIFYPLRRSILGNNSTKTGNFLPLVIPPMVTMLLSGLWHGAQWTFVVWGGLHGVFILLDMYWNQKASHRLNFIKLPEFVLSGWKMFVTFNLISFTWIFFRAHSLPDAFMIIRNLFVGLRFESSGIGSIMPGGKYELLIALCAIALALLVDVLQHRNVSLRTFALRQPIWLRWSAYYVLFLIILIFGKFGLDEFFYIQF